MGREAGMGVANTPNHNFKSRSLFGTFFPSISNQSNKIVIGAFEWGSSTVTLENNITKNYIKEKLLYLLFQQQ
jgi:hypothetical protein